MSTHKHIDKICCAAIVLALLLSLLFANDRSLDIHAASRTMGYESRLFDRSAVHTIDIRMDDWNGFIESCADEEYAQCSVVIDGELYKSIGIRAKGNTSLSSVSRMNSDRYSFKLEFDRYDSTRSYYGLDKLSLNNLIQDNTCMKDFLTYQMMGAFGVSAPLCSYVYLTVNGEDWGLYLAVEGIEDAFLERNYGTSHGELYKPDSLSFGGGRGNGKDFSLDAPGFKGSDPGSENAESPLPDSFDPSSLPARDTTDDAGFNSSDRGEFAGGFGAGFGSMGSSDVKLQYIDDDPSSYPNIFDNAKTNPTDADRARLIQSLKILSAGTQIESVVDVDAVLRYFTVHNFVVNGDSYTGSMVHNYYLYEENGRLSMLPWDYNLAFGTFRNTDASQSINDPIDTPFSGSMEDRPMLAWIFSDPSYTDLYHRYFEEFLETFFRSGEFERLIDETSALIAPFVRQDPTKFCTFEEFESGVAVLKEFCLLRTESVSGQLDGSIPSTAEGQSVNSEALIAADELSISAMGTMDNGMSGGGRQYPLSQGEAAAPVDPFANAPSIGESAALPERDAGPPDDMHKPPNSGKMPGFPQPAGGASPAQTAAFTNSRASLVPLGISILILIAGIVLAFRYRR